MAFHAYIHCKPDGTPFYVGKGNDARLKRIRRDTNPWHTRIVNKYGRENILVGSLECSSEQIALDLERGLVKRLKAMNVTLVNMTDGGGGVSGFKMSEESKAKIRNALTGLKRTEEQKKNMSLCRIGKPGRPIPEHQKQKIRESNSVLKVGNKYTLNRVWITDGKNNRMLPKELPIPDGWSLGMKPRTKA